MKRLRQMSLNVSSSIVFALVSTASAEEGTKSAFIAQSFVMPFSIVSCTGFVAKAKAWEDAMFVAADSCPLQPTPQTSRRVAAEMLSGLLSTSELLTPLKKTTGLTQPVAGLYIAPIEARPARVTVYEIAKTTPSRNETLQLQAFSLNQPFGKTPQSSLLGCVYQGVVFAPTATSHGQNVLLHTARCENPYFTKPAPGSPILNKQGQVVGAMVQTKSQSLNGPQVIHFGALSEDELAPSN